MGGVGVGGVYPSGRARRSSQGEAPSPCSVSHSQSKRLRGLLFRPRLRLLGQPADGQVVDHLLDLLHVVLEAVVALAQGVVLQVEQAESRVQLVDEVRDADGTVVISRRHAVYRQPRLEGNGSN